METEAEAIDISLAEDEEVLRRMWQQTEDLSRKREIRNCMYKLRERRLKEFHRNGEDLPDAKVARGTQSESSEIAEKSLVPAFDSAEIMSRSDFVDDRDFATMNPQEIFDSGSPGMQNQLIQAGKGSDSQTRWKVQSSSESFHAVGTDGQYQVSSQSQGRSMAGENDRVVADSSYSSADQSLINRNGDVVFQSGAFDNMGRDGQLALPGPRGGESEWMGNFPNSKDFQSHFDDFNDRNRSLMENFNGGQSLSRTSGSKISQSSMSSSSFVQKSSVQSHSFSSSSTKISSSETSSSRTSMLRDSHERNDDSRDSFGRIRAGDDDFNVDSDGRAVTQYDSGSEFSGRAAREVKKTVIRGGKIITETVSQGDEKRADGTSTKVTPGRDKKSSPNETVAVIRGGKLIRETVSSKSDDERNRFVSEKQKSYAADDSRSSVETFIATEQNSTGRQTYDDEGRPVDSDGRPSDAPHSQSPKDKRGEPHGQGKAPPKTKTVIRGGKVIRESIPSEADLTDELIRQESAQTNSVNVQKHSSSKFTSVTSSTHKSQVTDERSNRERINDDYEDTPNYDDSDRVPSKGKHPGKQPADGKPFKPGSEKPGEEDYPSVEPDDEEIERRSFSGNKRSSTKVITVVRDGKVVKERVTGSIDDDQVLDHKKPSQPSSRAPHEEGDGPNDSPRSTPKKSKPAGKNRPGSETDHETRESEVLTKTVTVIRGGKLMKETVPLTPEELERYDRDDGHQRPERSPKEGSPNDAPRKTGSKPTGKKPRDEKPEDYDKRSPQQPRKGQPRGGQPEDDEEPENYTSVNDKTDSKKFSSTHHSTEVKTVTVIRGGKIIKEKVPVTDDEENERKPNEPTSKIPKRKEPKRPEDDDNRGSRKPNDSVSPERQKRQPSNYPEDGYPASDIPSDKDGSEYPSGSEAPDLYEKIPCKIMTVIRGGKVKKEYVPLTNEELGTVEPDGYIKRPTKNLPKDDRSKRGPDSEKPGKQTSSTDKRKPSDKVVPVKGKGQERDLRASSPTAPEDGNDYPDEESLKPTKQKKNRKPDGEKPVGSEPDESEDNYPSNKRQPDESGRKPVESDDEGRPVKTVTVIRGGKVIKETVQMTDEEIRERELMNVQQNQRPNKNRPEDFVKNERDHQPSQHTKSKPTDQGTTKPKEGTSPSSKDKPQKETPTSVKNVIRGGKIVKESVTVTEDRSEKKSKKPHEKPSDEYAKVGRPEDGQPDEYGKKPQDGQPGHPDRTAPNKLGRRPGDDQPDQYGRRPQDGQPGHPDRTTPDKHGRRPGDDQPDQHGRRPQDGQPDHPDRATPDKHGRRPEDGHPDQYGRRPQDGQPGHPDRTTPDKHGRRPGDDQPDQYGRRPEDDQPDQYGRRPQDGQPGHPDRTTPDKHGRRPGDDQPDQYGRRPQDGQPDRYGRRPQDGQPGHPDRTTPDKLGRQPEDDQPDKYGKRPQDGQPDQYGRRPQDGQPDQYGRRPQDGQPGHPDRTTPDKLGRRPEDDQPDKYGKRPQDGQPDQRDQDSSLSIKEHKETTTSVKTVLRGGKIIKETTTVTDDEPEKKSKKPIDRPSDEFTDDGSRPRNDQPDQYGRRPQDGQPGHPDGTTPDKLGRRPGDDHPDQYGRRPQDGQPDHPDRTTPDKHGRRPGDDQPDQFGRRPQDGQPGHPDRTTPDKLGRRPGDEQPDQYGRRPQDGQPGHPDGTTPDKLGRRPGDDHPDQYGRRPQDGQPDHPDRTTPDKHGRRPGDDQPDQFGRRPQDGQPGHPDRTTPDKLGRRPGDDHPDQYGRRPQDGQPGEPDRFAPDKQGRHPEDSHPDQYGRRPQDGQPAHPDRTTPDKHGRRPGDDQPDQFGRRPQDGQPCYPDRTTPDKLGRRPKDDQPDQYGRRPQDRQPDHPDRTTPDKHGRRPGDEEPDEYGRRPQDGRPDKYGRKPDDSKPESSSPDKSGRRPSDRNRSLSPDKLRRPQDYSPDSHGRLPHGERPDETRPDRYDRRHPDNKTRPDDRRPGKAPGSAEPNKASKSKAPSSNFKPKKPSDKIDTDELRKLYQSDKISVDVSASHAQFASSLRAPPLHPDRPETPSKPWTDDYHHPSVVSSTRSPTPKQPGRTIKDSPLKPYGKASPASPSKGVPDTSKSPHRKYEPHFNLSQRKPRKSDLPERTSSKQPSRINDIVNRLTSDTKSARERRRLTAQISTSTITKRTGTRPYSPSSTSARPRPRPDQVRKRTTSSCSNSSAPTEPDSDFHFQQSHGEEFSSDVQESFIQTERTHSRQVQRMLQEKGDYTVDHSKRPIHKLREKSPSDESNASLPRSDRPHEKHPGSDRKPKSATRPAKPGDEFEPIDDDKFSRPKSYGTPQGKRPSAGRPREEDLSPTRKSTSSPSRRPKSPGSERSRSPSSKHKSPHYGRRSPRSSNDSPYTSPERKFSSPDRSPERRGKPKSPEKLTPGQKGVSDRPKNTTSEYPRQKKSAAKENPPFGTNKDKPKASPGTAAPKPFDYLRAKPHGVYPDANKPRTTPLSKSHDQPKSPKTPSSLRPEKGKSKPDAPSSLRPAKPTGRAEPDDKLPRKNRKPTDFDEEDDYSVTERHHKSTVETKNFINAESRRETDKRQATKKNIMDFDWNEDASPADFLVDTSSVSSMEKISPTSNRKPSSPDFKSKTPLTDGKSSPIPSSTRPGSERPEETHPGAREISPGQPQGRDHPRKKPAGGHPGQGKPRKSEPSRKHPRQPGSETSENESDAELPTDDDFVNGERKPRRVNDDTYREQTDMIRSERHTYSTKVRSSVQKDTEELTGDVELPRSRESSKSPSPDRLNCVLVNEKDTEELRPRYADQVTEPEDEADEDSPDRYRQRPSIRSKEPSRDEEPKKTLKDMMVKKAFEKIGKIGEVNEFTDDNLKLTVNERVNKFMETTLKTNDRPSTRPEDITLQGLDDTVNEYTQQKEFRDDVTDVKRGSVIKAKNMFESIANQTVVTGTTKLDIEREDDFLSRSSALHPKSPRQKEFKPEKPEEPTKKTSRRDDESDESPDRGFPTTTQEKRHDRDDFPKQKGVSPENEEVSPRHPGDRHSSPVSSARRPSERDVSPSRPRDRYSSPVSSTRRPNDRDVSPSRPGDRYSSPVSSTRRPSERDGSPSRPRDRHSSPVSPSRRPTDRDVSPRRSGDRHTSPVSPTKKPTDRDVSPRRPGDRHSSPASSTRRPTKRDVSPSRPGDRYSSPVSSNRRPTGKDASPRRPGDRHSSPVSPTKRPTDRDVSPRRPGDRHSSPAPSTRRPTDRDVSPKRPGDRHPSSLSPTKRPTDRDVSPRRPGDRYSSPVSSTRRPTKRDVSPSRPGDRYSSPVSSNRRPTGKDASPRRPGDHHSSPVSSTRQPSDRDVSPRRPSDRYSSPVSSSRRPTDKGVSPKRPEDRHSSPAPSTRRPTDRDVSPKRPGDRHPSSVSPTKRPTDRDVSPRRPGDRHSSPVPSTRRPTDKDVSPSRPGDRYSSPLSASRRPIDKDVTPKRPGDSPERYRTSPKIQVDKPKISPDTSPDRYGRAPRRPTDDRDTSPKRRNEYPDDKKPSSRMPSDLVGTIDLYESVTKRLSDSYQTRRSEETFRDRDSHPGDNASCLSPLFSKARPTEKDTSPTPKTKPGSAFPGLDYPLPDKYETPSRIRSDSPDRYGTYSKRTGPKPGDRDAEPKSKDYYPSLLDEAKYRPGDLLRPDDRPYSPGRFDRNPDHYDESKPRFSPDMYDMGHADHPSRGVSPTARPTGKLDESGKVPKKKSPSQEIADKVHVLSSSRRDATSSTTSKSDTSRYPYSKPSDLSNKYTSTIYDRKTLSSTTTSRPVGKYPGSSSTPERRSPDKFSRPLLGSEPRTNGYSIPEDGHLSPSFEKAKKIPENSSLRTPALLKKQKQPEDRKYPGSLHRPSYDDDDDDEEPRRTPGKKTLTTGTDSKFSKFGTSLKKTTSGSSFIKKDVGKKETELERIFDLDLLNSMLERATAYEERRSIREQIRTVKNLIENDELPGRGPKTLLGDRDPYGPTSKSPAKTPLMTRDFGDSKQARYTNYRTETQTSSETRTVSTDRHRTSEIGSGRTPATSTLSPKRDSPLRRSPDKPATTFSDRKSPEKTHRRPGFSSEPARPGTKKYSPDRGEPTGTLIDSETRKHLFRPDSPQKGHLRYPYGEEELYPGRSSFGVSKTIKKSHGELESKETNITDSIISSYGVGPTDDKGRPLFGLQALRRQKGKPETEPDQVLPKEPEPPVDIRDSSGRAFFGLKALRAPKKEDSERCESPKAKDSVVPEPDGVSTDSPSQRPRRGSPGGVDREEDFTRREMDSNEVTRTMGESGQSLRDMIRKHERFMDDVDDHKRTDKTSSSSSYSTSTVIRSSAVRRPDGTVSVKKNVVRGETTSKDDEEPRTRVTAEEYSYETPHREPIDSDDDKSYSRRSGKSLTNRSSTVDSLLDKYSQNTVTSSQRTTRKSLSPDRKSPERYSTTPSIGRPSSRTPGGGSRDHSPGYSSRRRDESDFQSSTNSRKSISDRLTQLSKKFSNDSLDKISDYREPKSDTHLSSYSSSKVSSSYRTSVEGNVSSLADTHRYTPENGLHDRKYSPSLRDDENGYRRRSSTPIEDVKETLYRKFSGSEDVDHVSMPPAFSRVGKGGSVKALSQKFQQAADTSGIRQSASMEVRVGSPTRTGLNTPRIDFSGDRSHLDFGDRSWSPGRSDRTDRFEERRTVTSTTTETRSDSGKSFLGNSSKVTGVQDIISRMRAADQDISPDDSANDSEARALLNKFLGASAMMSGMEPLVKSSGATSSTLVSQVERQRILESPTSRGGYKEFNTDNIDDIWDEKRLRQLLDACTDYERRRKLRSRLRTVMAEKSACEDLVAESREDNDSLLGDSSGTVFHQDSDTLMTSRSDGGSSTKTRVTSHTTYTSSSSTTSTTNKPISPFAKFQQLDRQNSGSAPSSPGVRNAPLFTFTDPKLSRSASGAKDRLLQWCQFKTKEYKNIQIENFSTSWSNGLAFCALIHHFRPEAFDYDSLSSKDRRKNFELAFRVAEEEANIAPLLDVEDMVMMKKPDWKCVFTYVQSIYHRFKNEEI